MKKPTNQPPAPSPSTRRDRVQALLARASVGGAAAILLAPLVACGPKLPASAGE